MSLHIVFGSDTARLAHRLASDIAQSTSGAGLAGLLMPTSVLVPNRNMEKWLRFEIARHNGIAANLSFPYLENGLWELVGRIGVASGRVAADRSGRPILDRLDLETLTARLAAILLQDTADPSRIDSSFVSYCMAGGGPGDPGFSIRLWQLAGRLAHLFREYEFNRSGMVREWLAGKIDPSAGELHARQAGLYRQACSLLYYDWDAHAARPARSLFQLGEEVFQDPGHRHGIRNDEPDWGETAGEVAPPAGTLPGTVFIFGLSTLSRYHCRLLWEISRRCDIRLYHVNGCHEFWQDVSTPFEERWHRIRAARVVSVPDGQGQELALDNDLDDNLLLKAWGKAGRETVRLLSELEDQPSGVTTEWVDEPEIDFDRATVLDRVRHGIRTRSSQVGRTVADDSLVVLKCPGRLREVEAVAERITALLQADPDLKLSDIVVLVTDMASYKPLISQVFDRDRSRPDNVWDPIPYNLADSTAGTDSVYAAAVEAMLNLAGGDFSRGAVFRLLFNPCFMAAAGVGPATVEGWAGLADRLGIFHDFHPQASGEGAFTWSDAFARLRLGKVMIPDDERPAPEPDNPNPFAAVWPFMPADADGLDAESFCTVVESLAARLEVLRTPFMPVADWGMALTSLFDDFLSVPADRKPEELVRQSLVSGLQFYFGGRSILDSSLKTVGASEENRLIPAHLAFEIVRGLAGSIPTGRGAYLSEGVTVATLKPMRPIPFKVTFILGLEEGGFPGAARESSLDLRGGDRRIGDVTTPDSGRHMFMETLLSTTQSLVLSYDAWDTMKDERHQPCSVVRQLIDFVEANVLPGQGDDGGFKELEIPLSPWGERYLGADAPVPQGATRIADRLVAGLLGAAGSARAPGLAAAIEGAVGNVAVSGRDRQLLRAALDLVSDHRDCPRADGPAMAEPGDSSTPEYDSGPITVTIQELNRFLRDPLKARLARFFGRQDDLDKPDPSGLEDEGFEFETFTGRTLKENWLKDILGGMDPDRAWARLENSGRALSMRSSAPSPYFRQLSELGVRKALSNTPEAIMDSIGGMKPLSEAVMGQVSFSRGAPGLRLAPASFSARISKPDGSSIDMAVEVTGRVDFVVPDLDGLPLIIGNVSASGASETGPFPRALIMPTLFGIVAGIGAGRREIDFGAVVVCADKNVARRIKVPVSTAAGWIEGLISDYLDCRRILENLPYDVAVKYAGLSPDEPEDEDFRRAMRARIEKGSQGGWATQPINALQKLVWDRTVLPERIRETIESRYGLLWRCGGGGA